MDINLLVNSSITLLDLLDNEGVKPRAAMWFHNPETDAWRFWIVPSKGYANDKPRFYRVVSEIVSNNSDNMQGINVSDIESISDKHPAITGLSKMFRIEEKGVMFVEKNMLNGFYLAEGIIIRMAV